MLELSEMDLKEFRLEISAIQMPPNVGDGLFSLMGLSEETLC